MCPRPETFFNHICPARRCQETIASEIKKRWFWYLTLASSFLLFIVLGINFFQFLHQASILLSHPYSVNVIEDSMWASSVLSRMIGLYPDYLQWPYVPTFYPPLFYLFVIPLHETFGFGIMAGRLLSGLSALGISLLLFRTVYEGTKKWELSAAVFLAFFLSPDIYYWGLLYRIDMLMLFFLALAIYYGLVRKPVLPNKIISSLFLLCALFTKQMCLTSLLILFSFWGYEEFSQKKFHARTVQKIPWQTLGVLGFFSLSMIMLILILQNVTQGRFLFNIFGLMSKITQFNFRKGIQLFQDFVYYAAPLLLFIAVGSLIKLRHKEITVSESFGCLGIVVSLLGHVILAGSRVGSDSNYVLETYLWLFFMLAMEMKRIKAGGLYKNIFKNFILLTAVAFSFQGAQTHFCNMRIGDSDFYLRDKIVKDRIAWTLKNTPKNVLVEDFSIGLAAGKVPVFEPYTMGTLATLGYWDPGGFIASIRRGDYPYLVAVDRYYQDVPFFPFLIEDCYKKKVTFYSPLRHYDRQLWNIYQFKGQDLRSESV